MCFIYRLDVVVFLTLPKKVRLSYPDRTVMRLDRTFFYIEQAGRLWSQDNADMLHSEGSSPSVAAESVGVHDNRNIVLFTYVDKMLPVSDPHTTDAQCLINKLSEPYDMATLDTFSHVVEFRVVQRNTHIHRLLETFHATDLPIKHTPCVLLILNRSIYLSLKINIRASLVSFGLALSGRESV
ncbi:hypothetical protein SARC_06343, partial [Sphaeroforma arctica JP610]